MNNKFLAYFVLMNIALGSSVYAKEVVYTDQIPAEACEGAREKPVIPAVGEIIGTFPLTDSKPASYRKFIRVIPDSGYQVQDYYLGTKNKLSDPFVLTDYCELFSPLPLNSIQGNLKLYWPNGKIQHEASYIDGVSNGRFSSWNKQGKLIVDYMYKDGLQISTASF